MWVQKTSCMWKRLCLESATCNCKNGKCLASIMDDSAIICDEVIDSDADHKSNDEAKSNDETNLNKKKTTGKT